MMKSESLRNLALLIRAKVWDRACSWYGISLSSGRYGCRTWWLFELMRPKKSSSAALNMSATSSWSIRQ